MEVKRAQQHQWSVWGSSRDHRNVGVEGEGMGETGGEAGLGCEWKRSRSENIVHGRGIGWKGGTGGACAVSSDW
jgi:hypothetical protein